MQEGPGPESGPFLFVRRHMAVDSDSVPLQRWNRDFAPP